MGLDSQCACITARCVSSRAASHDAQSSASEDFFSFVDDQGVLDWTDRWDSIPEKYRSKAKRLPL